MVEILKVFLKYNYLNFYLFFTFCVYECLTSKGVYKLCALCMPTESRRGCWSSWNSSYGWMQATMCRLGTKPGSSENAVFLTHQPSLQILSSITFHLRLSWHPAKKLVAHCFWKLEQQIQKADLDLPWPEGWEGGQRGRCRVARVPEEV